MKNIEEEGPTEDRMLSRAAARNGPVYAVNPSPEEIQAANGKPIHDRVWALVYNGLPPQCEYGHTCHLDTPLRKAISHFFGRNKKCTKAVPDYVWPHMCRKHYQRARYRNTVEWSVSQCILMINQVIRVQAWSDKNQDEGLEPVLFDWKIDLRKREKDRMTDINPNGKHTTDHEPEDFNKSLDDEAITIGHAIPGWLKSRVVLKRGYSSQDLIDIINDMKNCLLDTSLKIIPDLEFLPQFKPLGEDDETTAKGKGKGKTKANGNSTKRQKTGGPTTSGRGSSSSGQSSDSEYHCTMPLEMQAQIGHAAPAQFRHSAPGGLGQPAPGPYAFTGNGLNPLRDPHLTPGGNPLPRTAYPGFPFHGPLPVPSTRPAGGPQNLTRPLNHAGPVNPPVAETSHGFNNMRDAHQRSLSAAYPNGDSQPQRRSVVQLPPTTYGPAPSGYSMGSLPYRPAGLMDSPSASGSRRAPVANLGGPFGSEIRPAPSVASFDYSLPAFLDGPHGAQQPANAGNTGDVGLAFGAWPAKHMRHQSTPNPMYAGGHQMTLSPYQPMPLQGTNNKGPTGLPPAS